MNAFTETSAPHSNKSSSIPPVERFFNALIRLAEAQSRYQQVKTLQDMTDDELTQKRIARDDITHHVFRDLYYL